MTSLFTRLSRAGYGDAAAPPVEKLSPGPSVELLAELRRRIERLELRPPAERARLPPMPLMAGRGPAALRLEQLEGAVREDGVVVVRTRVASSRKVGRVAPAEALVAPPDVAAPLAGLATPAPNELLHGMRILDIETTGLAGGTGTLAFLVGIAQFERDGTLLVEQLILGAPAEEPKLLARLAQILDGASLLVTFNGRSFDAPLLRTRCILARRAAGPLASAPHLDLLPIARRLWRARAADCRLITLEERILGRRRPDDCPGSMAPAAYASFLRDGDAAALAAIVEHNRDDLIGTAALLAAALRLLEDPMTWAEDASELLAVGEHRLRLGAPPETALPLLERAAELARGRGASQETRRRSLTQLARVYRRAGRLDDARAVWERYRSDFPHENLGYMELAKLYEHRGRDPERALAVANAAPHAAHEEVQRRLARLRRRVQLQPVATATDAIAVATLGDQYTP